jgi:hypothetical protein
MGLFRSAICAALIAMTPLAAAARWPVHGSGHRHAERRRSSERPARHHRDRSSFEVLLYPTCIVGLRDSRGRLRRCAAAKAAFERDDPCPSTGRSRGACPGFVVDHIVPLKEGGADDPSNMRWQTTEDAKAKDKVE